MQHAGDLAKNYRPSSAHTERPMSGSATKVAAALWRRMASLYGHKWTGQYGSSPDELWTTALTTLDSEQIRRGLAELVRSADPWPPSLPEFMAMCRPPRRENAAMYRAAAMLPPGQSTKEHAREQLAGIMSKLRGA